LEEGHNRASSGKRGGHGALANKQAADLHAKSLDRTIRQLKAAGHTTARALCQELARREVPTARGGDWHQTTVKRLLARLS
jgi:hypothetical protein